MASFVGPWASVNMGKKVYLICDCAECRGVRMANQHISKLRRVRHSRLYYNGLWIKLGRAVKQRRRCIKIIKKLLRGVEPSRITETLEKKKLRTARGYRSTVLTPGLMNPQANTLKQKLGA
jgi:hypothetical protein